MNTRMIGFLLGRILMVEAGLLALPLLTALLYGEPLMPWLATICLLYTSHMILSRLRRQNKPF